MEKNKIKLSVVILAKNEEERIEKCIKSVSFADEILVIDNASNDKTALLSEKLHAKVIPCASSDFSELRNIGRDASKNDWILYVDADEIVPEQLKEEIQGVMKDKNSNSAYFIKRTNYYLGTKWPVHDQMQRLFQKKYLDHWFGKVHETAKVKGDIGVLTNFLIHNTHRTLSEMTDKTNEWSSIEATLRFTSHHPPVVWWRFLRVMATAFWHSFVTQKGYAAGTAGLIESIYQSFSIFITYAKLWEIQQGYNE